MPCRAVLYCTLFAVLTAALPQTPAQVPPQDPTPAIKALLQQQAADWNRGDLQAFARGYKDSPDILFMGETIQRGYAAMLQRYRTRYPSRAKMGTLSFTALEVQPLDAQFSTATGNFHLQRTAAAGGDLRGYFLLVLEKTAAGWKIVRDSSTALPSAPATHRTGVRLQ